MFIPLLGLVLVLVLVELLALVLLGIVGLLLIEAIVEEGRVDVDIDEGRIEVELATEGFGFSSSMQYERCGRKLPHSFVIEGF